MVLSLYSTFLIVVALFCSASPSSSSSDRILKSHRPLHFSDAIVQVNNYVLLSKDYLNALSEPNLTIDKALKVLFNLNTTSHQSDLYGHWTSLMDTEMMSSLIVSSYERMNNSNVSVECQTQLDQLVDGLRKRSNWSFRVVDAFGKPPSGILNGNLDWYGEFSECRNISALNSTWTGKYALVTKPIDPQDMFKPYSTRVIFFFFF